MAKYLLIVQLDCSDSSREKEFNQWYDEIHLPDMLKVPGLIRATRYVNLNPESNQRPKYVVLYEIETEDIIGFEKIFEEFVEKARNAGRIIDFIATERYYPFQPPYYKQIATQCKSYDGMEVDS
jgi:hypothetical protein